MMNVVRKFGVATRFTYAIAVQSWPNNSVELGLSNQLQILAYASA